MENDPSSAQINRAANGGSLVMLLSARLRHFDRELLAHEDEVRALAALHVLGRGLREGGDKYRERDGCVAVDVGRGGVALELAEDERLVVGVGAGATAVCGLLGGNLDGVLVAARRRL